MNAPLPPDAVAVARAPLSHFAPSATNRKHTDQEYLKSLAVTIEDKGVLQPITARPWPSTRGVAPKGALYEIVIGEGRWLASALAKQADIPFFWRDLTDEEALELQLIENLKRKNLNEIEEAEGYRRLMKDHGHPIEQLMKQFDKSRAYLYARLKLLDLCPGGAKYFHEGKLDASTALLVARIPNLKLQEEAAKEIAEGDWEAGQKVPLSYRRAKSLIENRYMLELAKAPFSRADEALIASAGRCHDCPKRTGNAADLFSDVKSADICIDPTCYEAKVKAHVEQQRQAAKDSGKKVISGKEAEKIVPSYYRGEAYSTPIGGGLVDLDRKVMVGNKEKTVRQLLGKDAPEAEAVIIDPHRAGHTIQAVAKETVKERLAAKGIELPAEISGRGSKSSQEKEAERKRKQEATYRTRLFDQIRSQLTVDFAASDADTNLKLSEYQLVAGALLDRTGFDDLKRLARLWIGPTEKQEDHDLIRKLKKRVANMERGDCCRLLLELSLVGEVSVSSYGSDRKPEKMLDIAQVLDIDADAIKTTVIAEMREKTKPKAAAKKPKPAKPSADAAAKPASTPTKAAQAQGVSAQPAAPAKTNGKVKAPKEPKAKAGTAAPAAPNEPASPVENQLGKTAWPFPTGAKKAKAKTKTAAPPAPNEPPAMPAATSSELRPAQAWPFPTGSRP